MKKVQLVKSSQSYAQEMPLTRSVEQQALLTEGEQALAQVTGGFFPWMMPWMFPWMGMWPWMGMGGFGGGFGGMGMGMGMGGFGGMGMGGW